MMPTDPGPDRPGQSGLRGAAHAFHLLRPGRRLLLSGRLLLSAVTR
jgi:hypothetical protein